jgi:hypothetical protein
MLEVQPLTLSTLMGFERQPSQVVQLGIEIDLSDEEASELIDQPEAWACHYRGRHVACVGIREHFPEVGGVAWGMLAADIGGAAHLAVTKFARSRILGSPLKRIEAIVRSADAEPIIDEFGALDGHMLLEAVLAMPTPDCVWARLVGMVPAHVLRFFGQAAETHVLFERVGGVPS